MDETTFRLIQFAVMAVFAIMFTVLTTSIIPWFKGKLSAEQLESVRKWAETFVLMAEQVFGDKTGPEKKYIVTEKLNTILLGMDIHLSHDQISDLIEAAVKGMRIAENSGIQIADVNKGDDSKNGNENQ